MRAHARPQGVLGVSEACCYRGSFRCAWERFLAERQQLHHIESEGRTDFLTVTSRTGILSLG